jgi:uncharacterized protein
MLTITLFLVFGFFSGITTVLFGFGGGFVAVPLIYRLVLETHPADAMHIAVASSTAVMIANSVYSTYRHDKENYVIWRYVFSIGLYIALGSIFGAFVSMKLDDHLIRYFFLAYLAFTILDCLFRKGFINGSQAIQELGGKKQFIYGIGIGSIATMLGVGGSVMTVPLLRRLGSSMKTAVVMANPLSIPVAIVGTLVYGVLGDRLEIPLGKGFIGYVDLQAFFILVATGYSGIAIAGRWLPKVPDGLHAKMYVAFLGVALISMY